MQQHPFAEDWHHCHAKKVTNTFKRDSHEALFSTEKSLNKTIPVNNGMLRHSLVTLEGEQDFFFTEPSYPKNLPSLFICRDFFSFCPFNRGRACLQALIEYSYVSSLFLSTFGGCVSRTPLSCRKFSLWKIIESPWQDEITRLRVDKNKFFFFF